MTCESSLLVSSNQAGRDEWNSRCPLNIVPGALLSLTRINLTRRSHSPHSSAKQHSRFPSFFMWIWKLRLRYGCWSRKSEKKRKGKNEHLHKTAFLKFRKLFYFCWRMCKSSVVSGSKKNLPQTHRERNKTKGNSALVLMRRSWRDDDFLFQRFCFHFPSSGHDAARVPSSEV